MSDTSVRDSADDEMNQPSKTTSDMTVSKPIEVETPLPEPAPPKQRDTAQHAKPSAKDAAGGADVDKMSSDVKAGGGAEAANSAEAAGGAEAASGSEPALRQVPIPPASEPLQYRAIGLIRGVYKPSEEQFTRGNIITGDETAIDAVLLGRVMSLVKKHVDLSCPHLWVVYPRTRPNNSDLHAQIVGIWEPESLHQDDSVDDDDLDGVDFDGADLDGADFDDVDSDFDDDYDADDDADEGSNSLEADRSSADEVEDSAAGVEARPDSEAGSEAIAPVNRPTAVPPRSGAETATEAAALGGIDQTQDGYFSIRGEVVRQSRNGDMTIKICQAPRKGEKRGRAFKLLLKGTVDRRAVGSFWDMHIQRQGNDLVIQEAIFIKDMPPTKRRRGGPPRRGKGGPPRRRSDRPTPAVQRQGQGSASPRPVPKPIKRKSPSSTPAE
ncbi:MAG: hypothetical protein ACFB4J_12665 [Elainellaceae cyanobacterium]